jgi:hypothetical protein
MHRNRRTARSESTWLRLALALGGVGVSVSVLVAREADRWDDPVFYLGAALTLAGAYIALAVLFLPLPLPRLLAERESVRFRTALDELRVDGQSLYARAIDSYESFESLRRDHGLWVARTSAWLAAEVSRADADEFVSARANAPDPISSYDPEHGTLRLRISRQLEILRRIAERPERAVV